MAFRAAMRAKLQENMGEFFDADIIYLKVEGDNSMLIGHKGGELGVLNFRRVYEVKGTPDAQHKLCISKGFELVERAIVHPSEGVCDKYMRPAPEPKDTSDFFDTTAIFLKVESGTSAALVSYKNDNRRQYEKKGSPAELHNLLTSKGFDMSERFSATDSDGACDKYTKKLADFFEAEAVFLKVEGASAACLVSNVNGNRRVHNQTGTPLEMHNLLTTKEYSMTDRFVATESDGLCDKYTKCSMACGMEKLSVK